MENFPNRFFFLPLWNIQNIVTKSSYCAMTPLSNCNLGLTGHPLPNPHSPLLSSASDNHHAAFHFHNLNILGVHRWVRSCDAYLSVPERLHLDLQFHPCRCPWQDLVLLYGWLLGLCVSHFFIHSSVAELFGYFCFLTVMNSATMNKGVQMLLCHTDFISFE